MATLCKAVLHLKVQHKALSRWIMFAGQVICSSLSWGIKKFFLNLKDQFFLKMAWEWSWTLRSTTNMYSLSSELIKVRIHTTLLLLKEKRRVLSPETKWLWCLRTKQGITKELLFLVRRKCAGMMLCSLIGIQLKMVQSNHLQIIFYARKWLNGIWWKEVF